MKRIKFTVWNIICICLVALCIGLIVLNAFNFTKLQEYEQVYTISEQGIVNETQQQTIDSLSNEIVTLKNRLQASNSESQDQLLEDMQKLVTYYFSVNENSPASERLDNMKPYLTESLFQSLSLKFQDDTITEESKYQSSIQISDSYITPLDGNTDVTVLLYCTVTISTTWGESTNNMMIAIHSLYDSTQNKWLADSLNLSLIHIYKNKKSTGNKSIIDLFPIIDYDNKSGYFKLKNGEYMDITKIVCKDLLSATNDDINFDLLNWTKFYKTYSADIKLIGINLPTDTRTQQQYIQHKIDTTNNEIYKIQLQTKLEELEYIQQNDTDRSYYMMTFAKTLEEQSEKINAVDKILGNCNLCKRLSKEEKFKIIFKLNNMNPSVSGELPFFDKKPPEDIDMDEVIAKYGYNPFLLEILQPQGGISFRDARCV